MNFPITDELLEKQCLIMFLKLCAEARGNLMDVGPLGYMAQCDSPKIDNTFCPPHGLFQVILPAKDVKEASVGNNQQGTATRD